MSRLIPGSALALIASAPLLLSAQQPSSNASRIADALAAAPEAISKNATVKDWPDKAGKQAVLREGSNGWVCMPTNPMHQYVKNNAMCIDEQWQEFFNAIFQNRTPKITKVGYSYMLTSDEWGSNTDPQAKGPTPDNQWHHVGSHLMIVYPDAKLLAGLPVTPSTTGPYVMFSGSPFAHVMVPIR